MRRTAWLLLPLGLLLGCARPEVEAFRRQPTPITVTVSLPAGLADQQGFQKEYASALRGRLATRTMVVPEGVTPPVGGVELQVDVRDITATTFRPSPVAVGVAAGVTVGALNALSGNRGWGVMDGLFWGLWAGSHAALHQERYRDRLGYRPQAVRAQVRLVREGLSEPLWVSSVEPIEVVGAMDPLPSGLRDDDGRIREEEAQGFARVVVQKLVNDFQWLRHTEQLFYVDPKAEQAPAAPLPAPAAPAPEPKKD